MSDLTDPPKRDRWARLRFSIIGPLFAAPPAVGELHTSLAALAAKSWRHPINGTEIRFSVSTLERWYYAAKAARDPVPSGMAPLLRQLLAEYAATGLPPAYLPTTEQEPT